MALTKASFSMITGAVFNVLDYGADPTGTTDSTTAIQGAINAARDTVNTGLGTGGAVIYLPRGVYLSSALTIDLPFISMQGDGWTATTIKSTGVTSPLLKVISTYTPAAESYHMFIKDIKFQNGNTTTNDLLWVQNIAFWRVENCWFQGNSTTVNTCVAVRSSLLGTFEQCAFRYASQYTVDVYQLAGYATPPNAVTFRDCSFWEGNVFGLRYQDGALLRILDCDFEGNGRGANDINHGGIQIKNTSPNGEGASAIISNTWFEANVGTNIRLDDHRYNAGGVYIRDSLGLGGNVNYGIYAPNPGAGRSNNVNIQNSIFQSANLYDFYFEDSVNATLTNCLGNLESLGQNTSAFPRPASPSRSKSIASLQSFGTVRLTSNSATPTVDQGSLYVFANTVATNVTGLIGGAAGQTLTFLDETGNTTLKNGIVPSGTELKMYLSGGTDKVLTPNDTITLVCDGVAWYQTGSSIN
jgi:hypothetical protein